MKNIANNVILERFRRLAPPGAAAAAPYRNTDECVHGCCPKSASAARKSSARTARRGLRKFLGARGFGTCTAGVRSRTTGWSTTASATHGARRNPSRKACAVMILPVSCSAARRGPGKIIWRRLSGTGCWRRARP